MGDRNTDLPQESDAPPVPLKTYQWEDIRRQKLEGRYPWTHLYKGPYDDDEISSKKRNHDYEPVIPMDTSQTPPPVLKITSEVIKCTATINNFTEHGNNKTQNYLNVPNLNQENSYEDSEDDISEDITAEEFQTRLEERYFSHCPSSSKYDYELPQSRSLSPSSIGSRSRTKSESSLSSLHDKMQVQAEKIKQKFRNFKEHISKDSQAENTPKMKRKNESLNGKHLRPAKKNKFNFRKHNPKNIEKLTASESQMPQTSRWSLPRIPSFSRSRSSSVKDNKEHSLNTESKTGKFNFHFSTYPRIFNSIKKDQKPKTKEKSIKSAPVSPTPKRSPFTKRWINKVKTSEKVLTSKPDKKIQPKDRKPEVVQESIFISLHGDSKTEANNLRSEVKNEENKSKLCKTGKMEIDNRNFIFISLHEERFPEKLRKLEEEKMQREITEEEIQIEKEIQRAETARKFHTMLRNLQNERKIQSRKTTNEKPEPVIITEVTDDGGEVIELQGKDAYQQEDEDGNILATDAEITTATYEFEHKAEIFVENEGKTEKVEVGPNLEFKEEINNGMKNNSFLKQLPQKLPRKTIKKYNSIKESRDTFSASVDHTVTETISLDEDIPMTKTYIKAELENFNHLQVEQIEPEHITFQFKNYEAALEKCRNKGSIEIENNYYSSQNSLARLETPVPPLRPSRTNSLFWKKKRFQENDKENYYDLDVNETIGFHTFPLVKPERPRRKFCPKRTILNSKSEIRTINEIMDTKVNNNIVNSKQLSVSFLPLSSITSNEDELMSEFNLRETSSMIHLNLSSIPPIPPKRKKEKIYSKSKFSSLPSQRKYVSRNTSIPSETNINLGLQIDTDIEYVDDGNSTIPSDSPPKRPCRTRTFTRSLPDDDRTSREIDSLPSEKSTKDSTPFYDSDVKEATNEYAVIDGNNSRRESKSSDTTRRKSRRFSDFFSLPRLRTPANYVTPISQTLDYRRLPSPSRPPRQNRSNREPVYLNDGNQKIEPTVDFEGEEILNFNLTTEIDNPVNSEDNKNLQSENILEKMKSRPLPPPPRPFRKPKDDNIPGYSKCCKKKITEIVKNSDEVQDMNDSCWEMKIKNQECLGSNQGMSTNDSIHSTLRLSTNESSIIIKNEDTQTKNGLSNECSKLSTRSNNNLSGTVSQSYDLCLSSNNEPMPLDAYQFNDSELNITSLNIHELQSAKFTTSVVGNLSVKTEINPSLFNRIEHVPSPSITGIHPITQDDQSTREESLTERGLRISSLIPEIGSDDESVSSTVPKITRPNRRKQIMHRRENEGASRIPSTANQATFAELMGQILQICYNSVGQAIQSLFEQVIPDDDKRNEVQAAVWIITIIVAGCLMLGLQSNEKVVHHHHWDFHFPPPN